MPVETSGWKNVATFFFLLVVALANWGISNNIQTVDQLMNLPNIFSMIIVMGTIGGAYGLTAPTKKS